MATQSSLDAQEIGSARPVARGPSADAVSAGFQVSYVAKLALAVVCGAAGATALLYVLLSREMGHFGECVDAIATVREGVLGASVLSALIQVAVTGAVVAAIALFASHKIAGPVTRLVNALRRAARGRWPEPVRFRRGDQVGRLESHFNDVSRLVCQRHDALEGKLAEVRAAEARLREALAGDEGAQERRAAAGALRERAGELARLAAKAGAATGDDPSG